MTRACKVYVGTCSSSTTRTPADGNLYSQESYARVNSSPSLLSCHESYKLFGNLSTPPEDIDFYRIRHLSRSSTRIQPDHPILIKTDGGIISNDTSHLNNV